MVNPIHKHAIKELGQNPAILTEQARLEPRSGGVPLEIWEGREKSGWVNKDFFLHGIRNTVF